MITLLKVTISGPPGSGTSTLVAKIADSRGWESMNGGDVFREEARSRGLSVEELSNACHPLNLPRLWRADSVAGGHIRTILNA